MRTTLDLNASLFALAKARAAREHVTLTRLIEEGLELRLRLAASRRRRAQVQLPVYAGRGGLAAGINPLSNRLLLDAADEQEPGA